MSVVQSTWAWPDTAELQLLVQLSFYMGELFLIDGGLQQDRCRWWPKAGIAIRREGVHHSAQLTLNH
jgi:hypothetical protein